MLHDTTQWLGGLLGQVVAYDGAIVVSAEKAIALGVGRQGDADAIAAVKALRFVALAVQSAHLAIFQTCRGALRMRSYRWMDERHNSPATMAPVASQMSAVTAPAWGNLLQMTFLSFHDSPSL